MSVSNAHSRANIKNSKPEFDENSLISNKCFEQFEEETQKGQRQTLLKYTIEGSPEKTFFPHRLKQYFTHRRDIPYHGRLLLKDQRIIVPSALKFKMKSILYEGYLDMEN